MVTNITVSKEFLAGEKPEELELQVQQWQTRTAGWLRSTHNNRVRTYRLVVTDNGALKLKLYDSSKVVQEEK